MLKKIISSPLAKGSRVPEKPAFFWFNFFFNSVKTLFDEIQIIFSKNNLLELSKVIGKKQDLYLSLTGKIDAQIQRIKEEESSPKNTTLYFSTLIESKNLVEKTMDLLETYSKSIEGN